MKIISISYLITMINLLNKCVFHSDLISNSYKKELKQ